MFSICMFSCNSRGISRSTCIVVVLGLGVGRCGVDIGLEIRRCGGSGKMYHMRCVVDVLCRDRYRYRYT